MRFSSITCLLFLLAALLALSFSLASASKVPATDQLYGIITVFGGQDTEVLVQTVSIDIDSGAMTTLATNFVYAGESITAVGISAFDDEHQQLYYATNVASAFIYGVDVSQKVLLPPVDIGAQTILDLKMDSDNSTLYISFQDPNNDVIIATYSTEGGPAYYIANLTVLLDDEAAQMGEAALDDVNDLLYFISYTGNGVAINTLPLANMSSPMITPLSSECQQQFDFLFTDPVNKQLYGIFEIDGAQNVRYSLASINATSGACNATAFDNEPRGVFTGYSYSPYTNRLYYAIATDTMAGLACYVPVPLSGTPTCTKLAGALNDLEVSYPR